MEWFNTLLIADNACTESKSIIAPHEYNKQSFSKAAAFCKSVKWRSGGVVVASREEFHLIQSVVTSHNPRPIDDTTWLLLSKYARNQFPCESQGGILVFLKTLVFNIKTFLETDVGFE